MVAGKQRVRVGKEGYVPISEHRPAKRCGKLIAEATRRHGVDDVTILVRGSTKFLSTDSENGGGNLRLVKTIFQSSNDSTSSSGLQLKPSQVLLLLLLSIDYNNKEVEKTETERETQRHGYGLKSETDDNQMERKEPPQKKKRKVRKSSQRTSF